MRARSRRALDRCRLPSEEARQGMAEAEMMPVADEVPSDIHSFAVPAAPTEAVHSIKKPLFEANDASEVESEFAVQALTEVSAT